ncbi:MAG: DUF5685 family protein [Acutalibacteraceae bacterium]|nr:DUF5685 family protein [Acutalibacteraceae bacterium]
MFGYVKAYKPELRIKEFELYKAVYCSLCRDLGKKYGLVSRFSLSYDFTFLALLQMSLVGGGVPTERKRCVCNPLKKCNYLCTAQLPEMPTAAAEIMLYSKLCDNIADEGFFKGCFYRVLRAFSKKGYKKAAEQFPQVEEIFKEYLENQNALERDNIQDIDLAADPTAKMLSKLFMLCSPNGETRALERLGYSMGRWIYILDAANDLQDDIKKKRYNPFKSEIKEDTDIKEFIKNRVTSSLNICIGEAEGAFDLLDIMRFKNILGNIIYVGLEDSQQQIINKEKNK